MDKKWVEKTINDYAEDAKLVNWHEQEIEAGELAEAIAQAHEEEMAALEHRYKQANQVDRDYAGMAILDMKKAQKELAQLRGQMALMAEALRSAVDTLHTFRDCIVEYEDGCAMVAKVELAAETALRAAPKVLQLDEVEFVVSEKRGWPALYMYALGNEADGYAEKGEYRGELMGYPETLLETSEATLIVLAKPEKEE